MNGHECHEPVVFIWVLIKASIQDVIKVPITTNTWSAYYFIRHEVAVGGVCKVVKYVANFWYLYRGQKREKIREGERT